MKRVLFVLWACLIAAAAVAQTTVDPATVNPALLDFSRAVVSIAGPDSIYIRSMYYGTEEVSVLLQYDGKAGGSVVGVYTAADKAIPDSYVAEYATVQGVAADSIRVSGIIAAGAAYAGTLKWTPGTNNFTLAGPLEVVNAPDTVDSLRAQLADQKRSNDALNQQVAELQRRAAAPAAVAAAVPAAAPPVPAAAPPAAPPRPARVVASAFDRGTPLLGNWKVSAAGASQQDAALLFAKAAMPVRQDQAETLYELTAKARETTWVGYGLHFFASGDTTGSGYGFGNSLLVWLTRDSPYYRTGNTYVQIYRSYDDVSMVQLASVGIPESIASELKTEVLYNVPGKTISVSVNGTERLSYRLSEALAAGDKVALRTLGGPVDFFAFSMKTR